MNLIERASRRIGLTGEKSLVERAAQQLNAAPAAATTGTASAAPAVQTSNGNGTHESSNQAPRKTQRQISIDLPKLHSAGISLPGERSILSDELRMIKRPLLDNAFSTDASRLENANLIMVASAAPSDGKTFVAANLAMSIASEHDVHVLLVDADIANPSVPKVLGFDAARGLIDVLEDPNTDLSEILVATDIDNLSILPAGRHLPLANELMASSRMTKFITDIAKRYSDRIVIFDSPPLLARPEASVLARYMGQVVFVIEAEGTSRTAINDALRLIDQRKFVGAVLNKTPSNFLREGFGQYYYYRGYGASRKDS